MKNGMVKVSAEVQWAFLDKPNDMSGKYQVDLCNLSDAAVKALEDLGLTCKRRDDKPEKGWYITVKSAYPIVALDTHGDKITDAVGNGSKASATISTYKWTFKNKKGISPSMAKLVIKELVTYNPVSVDDDDDEDGEL